MHLSYEAVDLGAIAERVVNEVQEVHQDRAIALSTVGDSLGSWDALRMEQVVSNLVGNAVRHGVRSSPIRVTVDGRKVEVLVLSVTNGGEIDQAALPHIFKPFHSATPAGTRADGLGLGLYIVEQVVRAHQGEIEVVTKHGATEFRVTLPRRLDRTLNR
jgi:signal transduction histidine kinase